MAIHDGMNSVECGSIALLIQFLWLAEELSPILWSNFLVNLFCKHFFEYHFLSSWMSKVTSVLFHPFTSSMETIKWRYNPYGVPHCGWWQRKALERHWKKKGKHPHIHRSHLHRERIRKQKKNICRSPPNHKFSPLIVRSSVNQTATNSERHWQLNEILIWRAQYTRTHLS